VELDEHSFGRVRLGIIPEASGESLASFLDGAVEPGSRMITDGWSAYPAATRNHYVHSAASIAASGLLAHEVLSATHRVFALVKHWVMGTLQCPWPRTHWICQGDSANQIRKFTLSLVLWQKFCDPCR